MDDRLPIVCSLVEPGVASSEMALHEAERSKARAFSTVMRLSAIGRAGHSVTT